METHEQELFHFADDLYNKVRHESHPYVIIAEKLNERFGCDKTPQEIFFMLYNARPKEIPRIKRKRGFDDKGVPKETTIHPGCVSVDVAIQRIRTLLLQADTKDPYVFVADTLNEEELRVLPNKKWLPGHTQRFHKLHGSPSKNALRDKFPGYQVWDRTKLGNRLDAYKEKGHNHDQLITWLNREKIIYDGWQGEDPSWTSGRITALIRDYGGHYGRRRKKPTPQAKAFVEANPDYQVWMSDEIVEKVDYFRARGFNYTADQIAEYLNRQKVIRGDYLHGNPHFNAAIVLEIFKAAGRQYEQRDKEAEEDALAAQTEPDEEENEEENTEEEATPSVEHVASPGNGKAPMLRFPGLSVSNDERTATGEIQVGYQRIEMELKYSGKPTETLAQLLKELFGIDV